MIIEKRRFSIECDIEGCFEILENYPSEKAVLEGAEHQGWELRYSLTRERLIHLCPEHREER